MQRRTTLATLLAAALISGSSEALARATVPAVNFDNIVWRHPAGRALTTEGVKQAIIRGAQGVKWQIDDDGPTAVRATLSVRGKHRIRTRITFSTTSFSVRYDSSENMNHWVSSDGRDLIHPNYNTWTEKLVAAIKAELERI